jgi:zinc/manganese transport system ATP-binding protein
MNELLVALEGVTCVYGDAAVLTNVDLDVRQSAFIGIVGPSGSGKTTLLRAILGMIEPAAGQIHRRPGVRVGYVPQVETVNWHFPVTVGECVLMARTGGRRWPWPSRDERAAVEQVLGRLGIEDLMDRHIRELSGGQQQRVFVARALLGEPDLLVLDEPTSGVDVRTRHEVLHLLGDLHESGVSILLSTHDLNGMAAHLPWLVCLQGSVIAAGRPRDVLTPAVLERTYGAPMDVLEHSGLPVVVDTPRSSKSRFGTRERSTSRLARSGPEKDTA